VASGGECWVRSTDNGDTWTVGGSHYLNAGVYTLKMATATHAIRVGAGTGALVMSTSNGGVGDAGWVLETLPTNTTLNCGDYPGPSAYAGPILALNGYPVIRNAGQGGGPRPALVAPGGTGGGSGGSGGAGGAGGAGAPTSWASSPTATPSSASWARC
jgi:hypothetical protein